jgi:PAS domain S-box-containing protein
MNYRRWLLASLGVMATVGLVTLALAIWVLYDAAFRAEEKRLLAIAQSQARLIDEIARFNQGHPRGAFEVTLAQVAGALRQYRGFGSSGEIVIGRLEGDQMAFLLPQRNFDLKRPSAIPFLGSIQGEPMRRALRGETGTTIGIDYRGADVLAAYTPLRPVGAGLVAKVDLEEIRAPYIQAALFSAVGSLCLIVAGGIIFRRISRPLLEREKVLDEVRKISHAIEQSPLAVFITDREGVIEYVNPRFTEMTGYTAAEAVGHNPRLLKSDFTPAETYRDLWRTLLGGHVWRAEMQDRRKDGSLMWVSAVNAPVRSGNGTITHFVAFHEDITERRNAEERAREAMRQTEIANRAKSEMLANMSHELRTPLNAIIGFAQAMKAEVFGPIGVAKYREYVGDIAASGEHLLQLISDILDVSAIEAGKMPLNSENVSFEELAESSLRMIRPRAEAAKVRLTWDRRDLPPIRVDPLRIKQVLLNLLSNAVKFTPEGGSIVLDAWVADEFVFRVSDTGIGMDEVGIAKALTKFGQVDGSLSRRHEGTGLGLPLAVDLVRLHGGTIDIRSRPGMGTTVTVTLPAERVAEEPTAATLTK